ncbi:ATP-dependent RNA helicase dbp6, partial [Irineochytrium annulatum]
MQLTPENAVTNPAFHLSPVTLRRLSALGITNLFPVQAAVLPRLLVSRHASALTAPTAGDLCVSAPTGSGKTLAYAIPVVESLVERVVCRLRCLVVVPTRDLAQQVREAFLGLTRRTGLRVAVVTGASGFREEQARLVDHGEKKKTGSALPGGGEWGLEHVDEGLACQTEGLGNGSSLCDILIATPGRLTDHLRHTQGFTLRHLRFLVVDEADRLLNQSYQGWLALVLKAAAGGVVEVKGGEAGEDESMWVREFTDDEDDGHSAKATQAGGVGEWFRELGMEVDEVGMPVHRVHVPDSAHPTDNTKTRRTQPLQKLLFSATLTRNPAKIAALQLRNPIYFAVLGTKGIVANPDDADADVEEDDDAAATHGADGEERYTVPATLTENMLVIPTARDRPLALLHLLFNLKLSGTLIFTKSVESATRLAMLIEIFA